MTTIEFNREFGKILGDDQSIQFMIGNEDGEQYVAIFYDNGEIGSGNPVYLDDLDIIFLRKGDDMNKARKEGIKYLKSIY